MRLQRDAAKRRAPEACRSTKRIPMDELKFSAMEKWTIQNLANWSEAQNAKDKKRGLIIVVVALIGSTSIAIVSLLKLIDISNEALMSAFGILLFAGFYAHLTDLNATLSKCVKRSGITIEFTSEEARHISKMISGYLIIGLVVSLLLIIAIKLK